MFDVLYVVCALARSIARSLAVIGCFAGAAFCLRAFSRELDEARMR